MTDFKVAKSITSAARIETAIKKAKESLVNRTKKSGVYEDFGKAEADFIETKFIEIGNFYNEMLKRRTQIKSFRNWCENYEVESSS